MRGCSEGGECESDAGGERTKLSSRACERAEQRRGHEAQARRLQAICARDDLIVRRVMATQADHEVQVCIAPAA